jgi:hypothetical protein
MRVYLSGGIEYSPDKGRKWRADLLPLLRELGHDFYDPAEDERKSLDDDEIQQFRQWKTTDLQRFQRAVRKIIDFDIDRIEDRTDYIICYWDESATKGAGTHGELTVAFRRGIPVYLVLGMPIERVSGWILGCANEVFQDFESLRVFLREKYATVIVTGTQDQQR